MTNFSIISILQNNDCPQVNGTKVHISQTANGAITWILSCTRVEFLVEQREISRQRIK